MNDVVIEQKFNNIIYQCAMCEEWKNARIDSPHAVMRITSVAPSSTNKVEAQATSAIMCKDCYEQNKSKSLLGFVDPSPIVVAEKRIDPTKLKL